jgi:hypothetical protein
VRRGRDIGRNGVDGPAVRGRPPGQADVVICTGQMLVPDVDLAIREAPAQERVLELEDRLLQVHPGQAGGGVKWASHDVRSLSIVIGAATPSLIAATCSDNLSAAVSAVISPLFASAHVP